MSDANTLKVAFNQPVNLSSAAAFADLKITDSTGADVTPAIGNYVASTDSTTGYTNVAINVSALTRGTAYNLTATGVQDYANNLITPNPTKTTFNIVVDTIAPTVTSVTSLNLSQAKVVFSKPVQDQGVGTGGLFTLTVDGITHEVPVADVTTTDNKTFTVNLYALLTNTDITSGLHLLKVSGYKDLAGNVGTATSTVTFAAAGPVVSNTVGKVENIGGTSYVVFPVNEAVTVTALSTLALDYTNADGIEAPVTSGNITSLDTNGDGVIDSIGIPTAGLGAGSYTATIAGAVKDTIPDTNPLSSTDVSFAIASATTAGNVSSFVQTVGTPNTVTVGFDSAVDRTTALNPNNYTIDGTVIASKAVFVTNTSTVKLTLIPGAIASTSSYNVIVNGVNDTNGVELNKYAVTTPLTENVNPTFTASITAPNKIDVKFNKSILATTFADADDLVVKVNGTVVGTIAPAAVTAGKEFNIVASGTGTFLSNSNDVITVTTANGTSPIADADGNLGGIQTITVTH